MFLHAACPWAGSFLMTGESTEQGSGGPRPMSPHDHPVTAGPAVGCDGELLAQAEDGVLKNRWYDSRVQPMRRRSRA
jgi:hypothetical protein